MFSIVNKSCFENLLMLYRLKIPAYSIKLQDNGDAMVRCICAGSQGSIPTEVHFFIIRPFKNMFFDCFIRVIECSIRVYQFLAVFSTTIYKNNFIALILWRS